jgi:hypothetical protein
MLQNVREFSGKRRIGLRFLIRHAQFIERRDQRLGHKNPAIAPKITACVGKGIVLHEMSLKIRCALSGAVGIVPLLGVFHEDVKPQSLRLA